MKSWGGPCVIFLPAGKSLFVDMLTTFLDKNTSDVLFDELFDGLHVHPEEKRGKHCRKYYVMQFNLALDACSGDVEKIRQLMNNEINVVVTKFVKKYDLGDVPMYPDNGLASLKSATSELSLKDPSAKLYILVDEYDRFTNELMAMGNLDSSYAAVTGGGGGGSSSPETGPLRAFLTGIKNLPSAGVRVRAFVTGLAPISLAEGASANNYKSVTFQKSIAGMFGFTRVDIKRGLSALGHLSDEERTAALEFATEFFEGYLYDSKTTKDLEAAAQLYNPQLSLNFLQMLCTEEGVDLLRAWQAGAKTTQELVRIVDDPNVQISESALKILSRSPLTLTDVATLVGRGRIECTLSDVREVFNLTELLQRPTGGNQGQNDKQRARMLAFMFAHGIVTFASRAEISSPDDFDKVALVAPNEMVREQLLESLGERLEEEKKKDPYYRGR